MKISYLVPIKIMSFSAINPSHTLGTTSAPPQSSGGTTFAQVSATPQITSTASVAKPAPIIKLPNPSPLIQQNTGTNATTIYNNQNKTTEVAIFSPSGTYLGTNVVSRVPLQPKNQDGSSRNVLAVDGDIVLVSPSTATSGKQPVTFDTTTGRLIIIQSSSKYKDDIKSLKDTNELDVEKLFSTLDVKSYVDKTNKGGEREYGFIAETLEKEFPQLLNYDDKGNLVGVKYDVLSVLLVAKVQSLEQRLAKLEAN